MTTHAIEVLNPTILLKIFQVAMIEENGFPVEFIETSLYEDEYGMIQHIKTLLFTVIRERYGYIWKQIQNNLRGSDEDINTQSFEI